MWRAVLPSWEERDNITKESNQKASTYSQILTMVPVRNKNAFHAMKNFGLNFQEFPEMNGTAISGVQEKRATLRGTQNFSEVIVLWLSSRNSSRNFGSMARCTEIQLFPEFLKPFPGNYRTSVTCSKFLAKWKAPMFSLMENLAL